MKIRVLSLDSETSVPPGSMVSVVTRPQVPFKGKQIHVPLSCARDFLIHDIRVGVQSQKISATPIPADTFSLQVGDDVERRGEPFDLDQAQIGMDVVFVVQNISAYGARFLASIIGTEE